jgi:hypothetical protein
MPRTYAVGAVYHATGAAAVARLLDPAFDPRREVILEEGTTRAASPVGETQLRERRPDRLVIDANLSAPGYVVAVEGFAPGWRARVDGVPTPVQLANAAFRAVAVGAGRHRVEMIYRPFWCLVGLGLSALTATACGAALAIAVRRRAS